MLANKGILSRPQPRHPYRRPHGQSLVETAFLLPILLLLVSGLIEFGFLLNRYLVILDAVRNAARFSSDSDYSQSDADLNCNTTQDFYRQTACLVERELAQEQPRVTLDPSRDDIVISVFSVTGGATPTVTRLPDNNGWSYWGNRTTGISTAHVQGDVQSGAPNTGILLVEVFHNYDQVLKLPWIAAFMADPVVLHEYTFMPLVSAEPTPTP